MPFIAGGYTAVYNSLSLGQVKEGFTLEWFENGQPITGDNFGQTPQDFVMQNIELFIECTLLEWNAAAAKALIWPFHATFGTGPVIGGLKSGFWQELVLTVVTDTPAETTVTTEDIWTFPRVVLAEGFPVRILKAPALKEIFLRMRVYPDASNVFFTAAAAPP